MLDFKTGRLPSDMHRMNNADISNLSSKEALPNRSAVAERIAKGNAFYTSGAFRDLKPMYKRSNLLIEKNDKKKKKETL